MLLFEGWRAKLTDFGVSAFKTAAASMGTLVGSPVYCAPEILRGERYCELCDVYSISMLLLELATKKRPFVERQRGWQRITQEVAMSGLRPVIPKHVDADFAGDTKDARSTSGGYLVLVGPNTFFPLTWLSKRQTSVSRSTTESEVVAMAAGSIPVGGGLVRAALRDADVIRLLLRELGEVGACERAEQRASSRPVAPPP